MRIIIYCKHKTTYVMRISDWSSDVRSPDLISSPSSNRAKDTSSAARRAAVTSRQAASRQRSVPSRRSPSADATRSCELRSATPKSTPLASTPITNMATGVRDRKSVVSGKRVEVRVELGGRRILKKKKHQEKTKE